MTGRVLLVVAGGIAAYKALELVRLLRKAGTGVTTVLTEGGARFVTPLSLQALSETKVYTDLWSLTDESEMGHIELSRAADLVVVAPASADILASMAAGRAHDLATTVLLATDKPVLVAPAMNVRMWQHAATVANMATLRRRGVMVVGPDEGVMACHEFGPGRLAEPPAILAAIAAFFGPKPLAGRHALVTSGPTHEPIDPVRYIANRSSGRQGTAIAAALLALGRPRDAGQRPHRAAAAAGRGAAPRGDGGRDAGGVPGRAAGRRGGVRRRGRGLARGAGRREAEEAARRRATDADLAAQPGHPGHPVPPPARSAPGWWSVSPPRRSTWPRTPPPNACARVATGSWPTTCDRSTGIMAGENNQVQLVTADGAEDWPMLPKTEVATRLAARIAQALG